jgi:DNA-binding response OmpR family regulator
VTADDGEKALAHVNTHGSSIDLVILDVMLPGLNGYQVLRHVRRSWDIPVLMLSARGEEQDKIDGLELGADDYIVKPFALRELLARVRAVARRRVAGVRPAGMLYRGDLAIDLDGRRALVQETELRLRPKEFGLLVALAMEPGKVLDRQRLLDQVWGEDVIVDERTVDVHISWLRGKLQSAGMPEGCIRTVYGSGYRFDPAPAVVAEVSPS